VIIKLSIVRLLSVIAFIILSVFSTVSAEEVCTNSSEKDDCITVKVKSHTNIPLTDIIVYLQPLEGQVLPLTNNNIVIAQRNKSFAPYVSVSQSSQPIEFVNQDDITHHIYSAGGKDKFSFKIRAGEKSIKADIKQNAEIAMGCNIHDWMSGYLLVLNTPYFAKTNVQGSASFNVEIKGKYQLVIWHPQLVANNNRMSQTINIEKKTQKNNEYSFTLSQAMAVIPEQKNEDDFDFLSDY